MINFNKQFIELAVEISKKTNCLRRQSGCVLVKNNKVLAVGHNGAPNNIISCVEKGECLRTKLKIPSGSPHDMCYSVCAEQQAILTALIEGKCLSGSTAYVTFQPCPICAKMLIYVGVKKVVFIEKHPNTFAAQLLKEANIELIQFT